MHMRNLELEKENLQLRQRLAQVEAEKQALAGYPDDKVRRSYPEGPRDPETGRLIVKCIVCEKEKPMRARSM
jgi:hypothetical protein